MGFRGAGGLNGGPTKRSLEAGEEVLLKGGVIKLRGRGDIGCEAGRHQKGSMKKACEKGFVKRKRGEGVEAESRIKNSARWTLSKDKNTTGRI